MAEALLAQPSHTVVAAVHDPSGTNSLSLANLPRGTDTKLITVKVGVMSNTEVAEAVTVLITEHE